MATLSGQCAGPRWRGVIALLTLSGCSGQGNGIWQTSIYEKETTTNHL